MANFATFIAGLSTLALDQPRQLATVKAGELKHPPNWIRQSQDNEELAALGNSYLDKPINFILISPDGTVRDGNRRLAGILLAAGPDADVCVVVTTEEITESVSLEIMLQTAEHTKSLSDYERFVGYDGWLRLTGASAKELATKIHASEATVSRILSLSKGCSAVVEAAKANRLSASEWALIVRSDDQEMTLGLKLSGATRDGLQKAVNKKSVKSAAVVTRSITLTLGDGTRVTYQNEAGVSLDMVIESSAETSKELERARKAGHDAQTLNTLMKKKARKA